MKKPSRPTYKAVVAEVEATDGFKAQTCWIADVLRKMGDRMRNAPNRKGAAPVKPCPLSKVLAIRRAIMKLSH